MVIMAIASNKMYYLPCAVLLYYSGVLNLLMNCKEMINKTVIISREMLHKVAKLSLKIKNVHQLHYFGVSIYLFSSYLCPLWNIMMYIWSEGRWAGNERRCVQFGVQWRITLQSIGRLQCLPWHYLNEEWFLIWYPDLQSNHVKTKERCF